MNAKLKAAICKFVLSRIYSGQELAPYLSHVILTQTIFANGMIQYRPRPGIFGEFITSSTDPVRYAVMAAAIQRLNDNKVAGSFAEVGVYKGSTSRIIHSCAPERRFFLFDSFEGFPDSDRDARFRDTSVESVMAKLGNSPLVTPVKGYVPGTFAPYAGEKFAMVVMDLDKYEPTMASLEFFYPRLVPGAYVFIHDYNSPESNWGVKRAVDEFLKGKPDVLLDIPDRWGSVALCRPGPVA